MTACKAQIAKLLIERRGLQAQVKRLQKELDICRWELWHLAAAPPGKGE